VKGGGYIDGRTWEDKVRTTNETTAEEATTTTTAAKHDLFSPMPKGLKAKDKGQDARPTPCPFEEAAHLMSLSLRATARSKPSAPVTSGPRSRSFPHPVQPPKPLPLRSAACGTTFMAPHRRQLTRHPDPPGRSRCRSLGEGPSAAACDRDRPRMGRSPKEANTGARMGEEVI
jgi:hypothetical protein